MKIIILHVIAVSLFGCVTSATKDEVRPFIPGIYTRHYKDEYTDSYDTISIHLVTQDGSAGYVIVKRSRFQKLDDKGHPVPGHELKKWMGVYEEESKTIWLQTAGKRIYLDPAARELKIGTEPYKKL